MSYYMRHGIFTKRKKTPTDEDTHMRKSEWDRRWWIIVAKWRELSDLRCWASTLIFNNHIDRFYTKYQHIMFCLMEIEKKVTEIIWRTFQNGCSHMIPSKSITRMENFACKHVSERYQVDNCSHEIHSIVFHLKWISDGLAHVLSITSN